MNGYKVGYATMTADEHEETAIKLARIADKLRSPRPTSKWQMREVRQHQNLAVMHMEDAQRMRSYGRK